MTREDYECATHPLRAGATAESNITCANRGAPHTQRVRRPHSVMGASCGEGGVGGECMQRRERHNNKEKIWGRYTEGEKDGWTFQEEEQDTNIIRSRNRENKREEERRGKSK